MNISYTFMNKVDSISRNINAWLQPINEKEDECFIKVGEAPTDSAQEIDLFLKTWNTQRIDKVEIWDSLYEARQNKK